MPTRRQCLFSRQIVGKDLRGRWWTMPSCSSVGRELSELFPSEAFDFRTAFSAAPGFLQLRRFIWSIFLAGYLRLGCSLNTRT